ncbi:MAG: ABC transporter ATP-binding protein [Firmicutes bacterium]|nr:ABC transporter ATP-binding protein [Bacillota bacterium]
MKRTGNEKEIMRKVLRYIRKHLLLVSLSILFAAFVVGLTLYLPILQGRAIDKIVDKGQVDLTGLISILAIICGTTLLTALLQWLQNIINNRITYRVVKTLRDDAFRKIQTLPLSYLDAHPAGDIVSRVIADADQFSDGLLMGFTQLFSGVLTILGTLVFMFSISWQVALLVVVLTPVSLFVAKYIAEHTYKHFRKQSEIRGQQTALIDEMIAGQKVVQAYSQQDAVQERFDAINQDLQKSSLKAVFFSSLTNPVTRFVNALVYAASGTLGAFLVIKGQISVGQLSSVLSYANQYSKPFNEISSVVTELQNAIACAGRLLDLIDLDSEKADPASPAVVESFTGKVDMNGVSFSYLPERPLIQDFNLHVKPGQKIAIVGPTGCGKTTLINLLMRFYDVNQGDILVEDTSIYDMGRDNLRSGFGMVLQDTWIKEASAKENISMGRPGATDQEIIAAAKAAHADEFIRRLPQGYDTILHDSSDLSQGQKQLLCIARVMLSLPPMLILDEATSSIDTRTELLIQQSFDSLTKGRTSFVVAHRLSTIRTADLILVMKDGNIIETGTHETLLQAGGFYSQLYNSQFAES